MRGGLGRLIDFFHHRIRPETPLEALHVAAFDGDEATIKNLIRHKNVDVNIAISTIMGASIKKTPLFLAVQEGNISEAKLLIELGADIEVVNSIGITVLMEAASCGDPEAVDLLLNSGASTKFERADDGATPLSFCTHADIGDLGISQLMAKLIDAGANVEQPIHAPQSVLMLAARKNLPLAIEVLLRAGADPDRKCALKWAKNWTALDHAINERSNEAVEILTKVTRTPPIARPGLVS
ncbi:ankyrin repeat domain-containing protein [Rhodospirillum sp. A1_3_36]|uniref:ankyrin repeat domain-containing protein n=1 Tax=Rhodospirillum sp. A1_3_36 TaxID=3391666 RepID=UPI0039A60A2D